MNQLKPSTDYELKVYIKNHVGYNSEYFLPINFATKYGNLFKTFVYALYLLLCNINYNNAIEL